MVYSNFFVHQNRVKLIKNLERKKGSPLKYITESKIKKLQKVFKKYDYIFLDYAMRYGKPSIKEKLNQLFDSGCSKILIILYILNAASTTASVQDEVYKWLLKKRWQPAIRTVAPWYDETVYINAIVNSIKMSFNNNGKPEVVMISFHGVQKISFTWRSIPLPLSKNSKINSRKVKMVKSKFYISFQSRFGLNHGFNLTDDLIKLANDGIKNITIVSLVL